MGRLTLLRAVAAATVMAGLLAGTSAYAADVVGLITKTEGNPFFVKMREGAQAKAQELGLDLRTFAGKFDGDNDSQVAAIENLIAAGAKGFAIVPSDSSAIVPTIKKARDAGLLVIVLDTPLDPMDAADATFATDNRKAGMLIGEWAKGTLGDAAANAKIAFLDLATNQPTVDYLRDQGFMQGFGIDVKDPNKYGDEDDPRICGHEMTGGAEDGGRTAMETLLQKCPDTNVVYTINEPAAAGAYQALKAVGKDDGSVLVVSIDGGCPGVANVKAGVIGATSQQYPLKMASLAMEAIQKFAATGEKPTVDSKLGFLDTGATLITDKPVAGVDSITSEEGAKLCWG
ncbi:sugar ABC transporter [Youhaiella tibetensis]|uniref:Sugar ABC transporter substrate-binding protein n=1 Tax=Paradevosia tibetensis TaxID=1447062 RepID=A0A5B9DRU0_9HYPH|nr:Fructose ABC transporter, substrate-binding component FrcB [Devosia sp. H5989]QEE21645.1 sugar ABC transporter substrate-binding protein [Youhaiella tibetensis]GGF12952.1 sugar ABC transporter [Youhaiella tibetensis]